MRRFLFGLLCASAALAQPISISVQGVTPTQALIYYAAPDTSACTLIVSESASFSPAVNDLNASLFSGASSDLNHDILPTATTRLIRVGLRTSALGTDGYWHSRALANNTQHYVSLSCDSGTYTGTATFTTGTPRGYVPEPPPVNASAWGNQAYPEFDYSNITKPVIDPLSGIRIYTADPTAWSASQVVPLLSGWYGGGSGWTNPGNAYEYATAVTTTSNTNQLTLYLNTSSFNDQVFDVGGYWPLDNFLDLGVDLYGSGSDASTAGNRTAQMALSLDSGQTAYTNWINVVLPATTNAAAGTFPTAYPSGYFRGWGKTLPRNAWPHRGAVTTASGVVTLTHNSDGGVPGNSALDDDSYFDQDWPAGMKIFINGSSGTCTGGFCTVASVQSATQLTLVENLTLAENNYMSAGLSLMIKKSTASGSISLSAQARFAKGYPHDISTSGGCSGTAVTSGDGITGYPCIFPGTRQNPGGLYFIGSSQPVIRLVSVFPQESAYPQIPNQNDHPNGSQELFGPIGASFDSANNIYLSANQWYPVTPAVFKVVYNGNWEGLNIAFQSTSAVPPATNELTWYNQMPASTGMDARSQILANTPFNESLYGSLTGNLAFQGLSVSNIVFSYLYSATQNAACWVFLFNASTGIYQSYFRTDADVSMAWPGPKYFGCHSVGGFGSNFTLLSTDNLRFENTSVAYGGPFTAPILGVQRSGSMDMSNTALAWPPAAPPTSNGYDTTCPGGIDARWIANGATGNQCVTVLMQDPCSSYAGASEIAASPCPWDRTKSAIAPLAAGDFLKWSQEAVTTGTSPYWYDGGGYMVVQLASHAVGASFQAVLQVDANTSYCSNARDGVPTSTAQMEPTNGWTVDEVSPFACTSYSIIVDYANQIGYPVNQWLARGHGAQSGGSSPGTFNWLDADNPNYSLAYNRPAAQLWQALDFTVPMTPAYAGYSSDPVTQSYPTIGHGKIDGYAFDFRHYNGGTGVDLEAPAQTIGSATGYSLQAGTTSVYLVTPSGTVDVKRGVSNAWAGEKYLIDISSAATGNQITDSTPFTQCTSYNAGECRAGSSAGAVYESIPRADLKSLCWASQINLRVPCAMAGSDRSMRITQYKISATDPGGFGQRNLLTGLMGPGHQYVYSSAIPTPDGTNLLFGGFLVNGYHNALMMAQLPPMPHDAVAPSTYSPVMVSGNSAHSVYIQFGYDENGSSTSFYCMTRQEACRAVGATINEATPFYFASETYTAATGAWTIAIPALSGHILYYEVVDNAVAGPLQAVAVP